MVKQKLAFNFDLLILTLYFFILRWNTNFLIIELIVSFAEDIKRSSGQLKRFNESVTDPKCLLKVETTSSCFDNNLSSWCNIIFSCILLFCLRSTVYIFFQNDLELQPTLNFSKYCKLAYLFRFATKFHSRLNLTMSLAFSHLFALFLRRDLVVMICLRRFLLKRDFWLVV